MHINEKIIAVIGLGYVGLPLALEFGKKYQVIGFDIDENRILELRSGKDRTCEASPIDFKSATKVEYTRDVAQLKKANIFIVTVPTPVDRVNRPNLNGLVTASQMVGLSLKKGDIVIYESTVYPGATEEICVPELEKFSGLKFNEDFYCGYSPERVSPGSPEHKLTHIKKITSGSTSEAAIFVDNLYGEIIVAGTYLAGSIKVAEAAKVIENCQRDMNIAFVNELSMIFEKLSIDTNEVLKAASTKWNFLPFQPGLVGGHCIGVDPYYLTHKAEEVGYSPQLILAGRRVNEQMGKNAAVNIIRLMLKNQIDVASSRVAILGITFKENCPDTRNSKVMDLISEFSKWNVDVSVVDPWADPLEVEERYGVTLTSIDNLVELDAVIVAVGHREFKNISIPEFKKLCKKGKIVFGDLKSIFDLDDLNSHGFTTYRF